MTDTIQERLRAGTIEHPKRWSGDCHSDLGGSVDEEATLAMMIEAANRIDELERALGEIQDAPDLNTAKSRAIVAMPTLNAKSPVS